MPRRRNARIGMEIFPRGMLDLDSPIFYENIGVGIFNPRVIGTIRILRGIDKKEDVSPPPTTKERQWLARWARR